MRRNHRNSRAIAIFSGLVLLATACSTGLDSTSSQAVSSSTIADDPAAQHAASSAAPATTSAPSITAAAPTTAAPTTVAPTTSVPGLPAGLPSTWFGSFIDEAANTVFAVEVDTATGGIVRIFEEYDLGGCIEEDAEGDCIFYNAGWAPISVDVAPAQVAFGLCCEPAVGWTQVFDRATGLKIAGMFGSEPAFSGIDDILVTVPYTDNSPYMLNDLSSGESASAELVSAPGDSLDWRGGILAMPAGRGVALWVLDGDEIDSGGIGTPGQEPDDVTRKWSHPTFQASGHLVVAENTIGTNGDSLGVVVNTSGGFILAVDPEIIATFSYGGRVLNQTYGPTGVSLIYTLADGSVHWQGKASSGILAEAGSNYLAAAW